MVDISAAYNDAKYMSDDALKQELAAPSGMIPGYIVMAELQDRAGIRGGASALNMPSMKDQMLAQPSNAPSRQYSRGGMIAALNPLDTVDKVLRNPDLSGGFIQDQMNQQSGGLPSLQPAQAPGAAQAPSTIGTFQPQPSNAPQAPIRYQGGGLASLMR